MSHSTSTRALGRRLPIAALTAIALMIALPALAFAHAVVYPKSSTPGGYERYVLRVPNERDVATTRVELRIPDGVRVTAFEDVPGWQIQVLTDSAKRIIGAVWTGQLPVQRFVEFPFVAANPRNATQLVWPAYQTYANGERVDWTGAEGTKRPASVTRLTTHVEDAAASPTTSWVSWAALVVALVSLGLVLRRPAPARAS